MKFKSPEDRFAVRLQCGIINIDTVTMATVSMTHRGAIGSDGKTGDGCGLLFDLNRRFFQKALKF